MSTVAIFASIEFYWISKTIVTFDNILEEDKNCVLKSILFWVEMEQSLSDTHQYSDEEVWCFFLPETE